MMLLQWAPHTACRYFLLLMFLMVMLVADVSALVIRLPSHSEQCFLESATRGDKIVGTFHVVSGGSLDVDVRVRDPSGQIVWEQARRTDDVFHFYAGQSGAYTVCFSNSMSYISSKVVSFNLYAGKQLHEKDAASTNHITPLVESVAELTQGINAIRDANAYMKVRERVHHNTVISTNSRVVWWRCIQIAALLAMAAFKTFFLTHMFEKKRGA